MTIEVYRNTAKVFDGITLRKVCKKFKFVCVKNVFAAVHCICQPVRTGTVLKIGFDKELIQILCMYMDGSLVKRQKDLSNRLDGLTCGKVKSLAEL